MVAGLIVWPVALGLGQGSELPGLRRPTLRPAAPAVPAQEPPPEAMPEPGERSVLGGSWTIVLASFRGEQRAEQAVTALEAARAAGLGDALVDRRGEATIVSVGRFDDPSGEAALARLKLVRELRVAGVRPYLGAFFAPPGGMALSGSRPEYNLASAARAERARAEAAGEKAPELRYTLQVAVYGRDDLNRDPTEAELAESRKAAEEAAVRLRREGERAYYFHGPRRSMVTIGLWSDDDLASASTRDRPGRDENAELTTLRKRFPHNLYNGAGLMEKSRQGTQRLQPSVLVVLPEK